MVACLTNVGMVCGRKFRTCGGRRCTWLRVLLPSSLLTYCSVRWKH